jgi:putative ABC transport system ATP-binding protein
MAVVELDEVTRRYQVGSGTVTALDGVSLEVDAGEFVVVLGPSGSGKTTLLNMIGALDVPTSGHIRIAGKEITGAGRKELARYRRATVGFIFQTFNLFPALTAVENVQFGIDVSGRDDEEDADGGNGSGNGKGGGRDRDLAARVLADVGLGDRLHHFANQLSGGEQQRVAIARALATGSPVLLADEPTGELDFHTGVQILELLQRQADDGSAVIVVTHNREISRAADRVVELSGGRVVADGSPPGGRAPLTGLRW